MTRTWEEPQANPPRADAENLRFARLAVLKKFATSDQVAECLSILSTGPVDAKGRSLKLGELLIQKGYLSLDAVQELTQLQTPKLGSNLNTPPTSASLESVPDEYRKFVTDHRRRFGRYALIKEVGRGGMGQVFKAWDTALDRTVAVKFLTTDTDPDDVARFDREAKIAASITHPHIASMYEVGMIDKRHFIAMQFIDGKSMSDLKVVPVKIAKIMRDVALAVDHAHKAGIVHRDLKPANIMVDAKDHAYVMDFGIAKSIKNRSHLTATGTILGTPSYMSPEQAEGKALTGRSDVYSLGATLYHALVGRPPFEGKSALDTIKHVVADDVTPPTQIVHTVPTALERIVLKAMDKNPQKRYATAKALADDLDRFLQKKEVLAKAPSALDRMVRQAAKRRTAVVVSVAAVVVAISLGAILVTASSRSAQFNEAAFQADRHFKSEKYDQALKFYTEAQALDPDDERIRKRIADCSRLIEERKKEASAKVEADRLEAERKQKETELKREEEKKQREEAERKAEEEKRQREEAERQKLAAEEAQKRRNSAVPEFEKGKELVDQSERDLYRPGANLDDARAKAGRAVAHFDSALKLAPAYAEAFYYRGRARLMLLEYVKAESDFTSSIASSPAYAPALVARGKLALQRWLDSFIDVGGYGRLRGPAKDKADKHVEKALADFAAASRAGQAGKKNAFEAMVLFTEFQYAACVEACDRAIRENGTDEEVHKLRGDALLLGGGIDTYRRTTPEGAAMIERALASYGAAIALRTNYAEARAMRAYGYMVLGRRDLAGQDLEAALRTDPRSFITLTTYAKHFSDLRTPEGVAKSEEFLREAIRVKPDTFSARVNLAVAMAETRFNPQAERYLDEAIELNPAHAWGWYLKGALIAKDGRNEEAHELLDKAIAIEPETPTFWYNRGAVRANMGRRKEAVADFQEAIRRGHPEPDKIKQLIDKLK